MPSLLPALPQLLGSSITSPLPFPAPLFLALACLPSATTACSSPERIHRDVLEEERGEREPSESARATVGSELADIVASCEKRLYRPRSMGLETLEFRVVIPQPSKKNTTDVFVRWYGKEPEIDVRLPEDLPVTKEEWEAITRMGRALGFEILCFNLNEFLGLLWPEACESFSLTDEERAQWIHFTHGKDAPFIWDGAFSACIENGRMTGIRGYVPANRDGSHASSRTELEESWHWKPLSYLGEVLESVGSYDQQRPTGGRVFSRCHQGDLWLIDSVQNTFGASPMRFKVVDYRVNGVDWKPQKRVRSGSEAETIQEMSAAYEQVRARKEVAIDEIEVSFVAIPFQGCEGSTATRTKEQAEQLAAGTLARIKSGEDARKLVKEFDKHVADTTLITKSFRGMYSKPLCDTAWRLQVGEAVAIPWSPTHNPLGWMVVQRLR